MYVLNRRDVNNVEAMVFSLYLQALLGVFFIMLIGAVLVLTPRYCILYTFQIIPDSKQSMVM